MQLGNIQDRTITNEIPVIEQEMPTLWQLFSRKESLTIAVVTETWYPDVNGVAHSIYQIIKGLLSHDAHIQLFHLEHEEAEIDNRISYFPQKGFHLPFYPEVRVGFPCKNKFYKQWKQSPPDIVHIVTEGPLGLSALKAAEKLNIPVISSYHTNFQQYCDKYNVRFLHKPTMSYVRNFHNRTQATLVPTHELKQELETEGFNNVEIMSRGIDTDMFNSMQRKNSIREGWQVSHEATVLLFVGRLAAEKNLQLAIDAYKHAKQIKTDIHFVIVGDGPERKKLQQENPDIIFTGMKRGQELAEHYASADVFLSPSTTETFGNTVLEAMASGLAVVSYDYAAAHQYIDHYKNGILIPMHDQDSFIQETNNLVSNQQLLKQISENARLSLMENSWSKVSTKLLFTIHSIIGEGESYE